MKAPIRKTRHNIDIVITETVDMTLPDEGGALVVVEHNRNVKDAETLEVSPAALCPEDLLDILSNLAIGTLLNASQSPVHKFQASLAVGRCIVEGVATGLRGLAGDVDGLADDLTTDQTAALQLSMSAPAFKAPLS